MPRETAVPYTLFLEDFWFLWRREDLTRRVDPRYLDSRDRVDFEAFQAISTKRR